MASKLNTSTPNKLRLYPPEPRHARHDEFRKTRNTSEVQRNDPSPMVKNFTNFRCDCDPPMTIPDPLFDSGRGKAAGSKRKLKVPHPSDD